MLGSSLCVVLFTNRQVNFCEIPDDSSGFSVFYLILLDIRKAQEEEWYIECRNVLCPLLGTLRLHN